MDQLGMVTLRPTFYHTYQEHVFTDVEPCPFINQSIIGCMNLSDGFDAAVQKYSKLWLIIMDGEGVGMAHTK